MKVENNLQFSPGWILYRKKNQINKCHPKMLPLRNMLQKKPNVIPLNKRCKKRPKLLRHRFIWMPRLRCQNREFCTSLKDNSGVIWHGKKTQNINRGTMLAVLERE